jgi:hypothetical protein
MYLTNAGRWYKVIVVSINHERTGVKMIYKIETPKGFLPYEFATKQDAQDYAMGILSWQGTKYRIVGPIIVAVEA